jgi:septum formation protein
MLSELSGRTHQVHTAVAVVHLSHDGTMLSQAHGLDSAAISMTEITPEKMEWYLATGESMGKAGSYAVQGDGGALVERVEGSLTTVIGLPLDLLSDLLVQVDCGWKNEA